MRTVPLVRAPCFRADQSLGRTFALGHVRHVQVVLCDRPVQMLAAILPYAKAVRLLCWIAGEGLQLPAILAAARQRSTLLPILGRFRWIFAASQEEFCGVLPETQEAGVGVRAFAMPLTQQ